MGFFGSIGRTLARPYTEPIKRISADAVKIKGHLQAAKEAAKDDKSRYEWIDEKEEDKARITSSQDAFEIIYKKNGWDQEQVDLQIVGVKRAKLVAVFMLWLTFFATACALIYLSGPWNMLFTIVMCVLCTANFILRIFKYTIFRAQLEERDLMNFKEFWLRDDRWVRLFT